MDTQIIKTWQHYCLIRGISLQRIETVKGAFVTPILGAYHLPTNERPKIIALVT